MSEAKTAFFVRCVSLVDDELGEAESRIPCLFAWPLLFLPMEIQIAARIMKRALCPVCGGADIVVGASPIKGIE